MRILFVTVYRRWYSDIVKQLREKHHVDYVFRDSRWGIVDGDYHVHKLFGRDVGFRLLSSIVAHWLLLTRSYDFCVTDCMSVFKPVTIVLLRYLGFFGNISFIHDVRSIPVEYPEHLSVGIHRKLAKQLRFADRFYQGISLITDETKRYLQALYGPITKPTCTWGSGVLETVFRPMPRDPELRCTFGFEQDDFVAFYHGSFGNARGVVELIEGFALARSEHSDMRLLLVGRGAAEGRMRDSIEKLGLSGAAVIHGQVEIGRVPSLISIADLCVVPLSDIDWWRVSSPLKLMEYIACGKTVLLTEMIAHTDVVGNTDNYFWFKDVTAESISRVLEIAYRSFKEDPEQYYRRGMIEREKHLGEITWHVRLLNLERFMSGLRKA